MTAVTASVVPNGQQRNDRKLQLLLHLYCKHMAVFLNDRVTVYVDK